MSEYRENVGDVIGLAALFVMTVMLILVSAPLWSICTMGSETYGRRRNVVEDE